MIYGFDTDDADAATAALCLYVLWRSRDLRRFKITPSVWEQVERFAKAAAKRADTLPRWLEAMKPRLLVGTLSPRWIAVALGADPEAGEDRSFALAPILTGADQRAVLGRLYRETAYVVLLVRDRLERERPIEARIVATIADRDDAIQEVISWT